MSVGVAYPVEVTQYQVSISRNQARIELKGIEVSKGGVRDSNADIKWVGVIEFSDSNDKDIINRVGLLLMRRPLVMLSGILDLLRNERPLFLRHEEGILFEGGTLSTSLEPVGEEEDK